MANTRASSTHPGSYPAGTNQWVEDLYRENGMEPPWLLDWEDGKVVGTTEPSQRPAPRHEA